MNENSVFIVPDLDRTRLVSDAQLKAKKRWAIIGVKGEERRGGERRGDLQSVGGVEGDGDDVRRLQFAFVLRLEDARGLARLHGPDLHAFVVNGEQISADEVNER